MSLQPEAVAYHTDATGSSYFFGAGGGGGGSGVTLNNGINTLVAAGFTTLPANVPGQLTTGIVTANYGADAINVIPLLMTQVTDCQLTSSTVPLTGDTLTFYVDVSTDSGTPLIITPAVNIHAFASGTTYQLQFNDAGVTKNVVGSGAHTYLVRLMGLYTTTGTGSYAMSHGTFSLNSQVVGCIAS